MAIILQWETSVGVYVKKRMKRKPNTPGFYMAEMKDNIQPCFTQEYILTHIEVFAQFLAGVNVRMCICV